MSHSAFCSLLLRYTRLVDTFTEHLGRVIAWLTLIIVLLTFAIVVLRYGFNLGWIALQEAVLYAHGCIFMLGAAFTLKHDGHVRVDIFYQRFSYQKKALVNLLGTIFLLLPVCVFIGYISFDYIALSWRILEKSNEPGGLPLVYLNKTLILLLVVTLSLQGLAELCRNAHILLTRSQSSSTADDATQEGR
ncbi:TRAP transporter small permease subunit [Thalassotalea maritima]|uniref:TRAP transporter small permease subunit n=1 Tax=Thalassotalea maritima TaxID=3242416 RepID=UPI0035293FFB